MFWPAHWPLLLASHRLLWPTCEGHHQRTKHIARRHFFIRELVENLQMNVPFVGSADNLADFFTKPLPSRVFFPMRDRIMNMQSVSDHGGVSQRASVCGG